MFRVVSDIHGSLILCPGTDNYSSYSLGVVIEKHPQLYAVHLFNYKDSSFSLLLYLLTSLEQVGISLPGRVIAVVRTRSGYYDGLYRVGALRILLPGIINSRYTTIQTSSQ